MKAPPLSAIQGMAVVNPDSKAVVTVKDPDLPMVLLQEAIQLATSGVAFGYTDTPMHRTAGSWQTL